MQNLTLPTSQTLALGATLNSIEAIKSSANSNKPSLQQSTSFEMMLKKQVRAHKESLQDKTVQQNITQKNTNQKVSLEQKNTKIKTDHNEKIDSEELKTKQSEEAASDTNISISQMLDEAKALLVDKKVNDLTNDHSFANITNQELSQEPPPFASSNSLTKNINIDLNASILGSSNSQAKVSLLPTGGGDVKSDLPDTKQDFDVEGKDLPSDRLLWASVNTSKSSSNANQRFELANSNIADSAKFSDIANSLSVSANPQNQSMQLHSVILNQPLGSSNQINAYPGKTGWDQAISQKIVWMVGAAEQTATLSLNPPDLGPLQVVINVSNNMADTTFISNNAEVRQALQDGMANLREKMAESGIQLGQANVNSGGRSQQEFSNPLIGQQSTRVSEADSNLAIPSSVQTTRIGQVNNGLVDIFA